MLLTAISTASAAALPPSYRLAFETSRPVSRVISDLVLEHDLQVALADLGLVGRVRRVEFAAAGELIDGGGNEMVVAAAAEETDFRACMFVLCRERGHVLREFDFASSRAGC